MKGKTPEDEHCIYLDRVPPSNEEVFWISFESDPKLKKSKGNIYGRCLPCIQNLYNQLRIGKQDIALGTAYQCWKITVVVRSCEECIALLSEFERRHPHLYVYGKIGNGKEGAKTRVVVFHAESIPERDRVLAALKECLPELRNINIIDLQISRACSVLYDDLFGDWRDWRPIMKIKYPENVDKILDRIRKVLFWAKR